MRIPEAKIDEVRSASDIVDLVSSYIKLKKRGKSYLGLCPFHQEKTPSFTVSGDKQMYHCFGCGAGGNAFTFVMEVEKVSFVEAVRTLANRSGILIIEEGPVDQAKATEQEQLYAVCRAAAKYFHDNMMNTVEGKLALEYFRHRGFKEETIRKFGLGYAMHSWDGLLKLAEKENWNPEMLDKAGLLVKREDNSGYYDRFRGRAIFPILSASGRTIAFGARKMREDDPLGKYINSPETPIYNKSQTLYGLFQSKDAIRAKELAILVEGYADVISAHQAGIENIVASSGTALTEEQVELVGRYAKNITLVYDADSAGSKATLRGVDLIIERGFDVKVAELPEGDDPDAFVKKHGGVAFAQLLAQASSFLDFKAKTFQAQGYLDTPEGQTRAVRSIVESIARMDDEIKRGFYIKHLSQRYGIYESTLFRELEKQLGQQRRRGQFSPRRETQQTTELIGDASPASHQPNLPAPAAERDLLCLMLEQGPEMVNYVLSHIGTDVFTHPGVRRVFHLMLNYQESGESWDANTLMNDADDDELRRFIADTVFSKYEISKSWTEMGRGPEETDPFAVADISIAFLRKQELDKKIAENLTLLKEAEAKAESTLPYQQQILALQQQKRDLEKHKAVRGTTFP